MDSDLTLPEKFKELYMPPDPQEFTRRQTALDLAIKAMPGEPPEETVKRAAAFLAFLKGK